MLNLEIKELIFSQKAEGRLLLDFVKVSSNLTVDVVNAREGTQPWTNLLEQTFVS